jgi:hypothetical protein
MTIVTPSGDTHSVGPAGIVVVVVGATVVVVVGATVVVVVVVVGRTVVVVVGATVVVVVVVVVGRTVVVVVVVGATVVVVVGATVVVVRATVVEVTASVVVVEVSEVRSFLSCPGAVDLPPPCEFAGRSFVGRSTGPPALASVADAKTARAANRTTGMTIPLRKAFNSLLQGL